MKIIKRTVIAVLILLVLLIGAAFIVPIMFKDKLLKMAQDEINNTVNAEVLIGDVDITIFKSFPDLTLKLQDLEVKGTGLFSDVTLASIDGLLVTVDIKSVLGGENIKVKKIGMDGPKVHVKVMADGVANYDIMKESDDVEEASTDEGTEGGFKLALEEYSISDGRIIYDDISLGFRLDLFGLDHTGSGDLNDDLFTLKTLTTADTVNVIYEGIPYIDHSKVDLKMDMEMDMAASKYTFQENELLLDELPLKFNGYVAMPTDDIDMDLSFKAEKTDLRYLLSMVPAEFLEDLEGVDIAGKFGLAGEVTGIYNDSIMPGFNIDLTVDNGRIAYPDLPKSIDDIFIQANVNSPQGMSMDGMVVDVPKFDMRIADGPIKVRLNLKRPISDPYIDLDLAAQINLDNLKDAMPLEESEALNGSITADIKLKGAMSAVEEERYEDFYAAGELIVIGMNYSSDSLPYDVVIDKAYMSFSPEYLELGQFDLKIGGSDLSANGRIDNYLSWLLKDETVKGNFTMRSKKFDLLELMGEEEEEGTAETTGEAVEDTIALAVLEVPAKVDFTLDAGFDLLVYDNLDMKNVRGAIVIKDQKASLRDLKMELLGGTVNVNGSYSTPKDSRPLVDFNYDVRNMDIKTSAEYIHTIQTLAPIARSCTGKFSTNMNFNCELDNEMAPVESTLTGSGSLSTGNVSIDGFQPLVDLAQALKIKELESTSVNDVRLDYNFYDGKVFVKPFDVKIDRLDATIAGSTSFEQDIDYVMNTEVPTDIMGSDATAFLEGLSDEANKLGADFSVGDKIKVDVLITGTIDEPKITVRPKGVGQNIMETVKEEINKEIDKQKAAGLEEARKQADLLMVEAEKQAQVLRDEAKKLSDQARAEGYAQAQKLEDDASDPFAKIAANIMAEALRKETDKQADNINKEADKQANQLLNVARQQADKILEEAAKI